MTADIRVGAAVAHLISIKSPTVGGTAMACVVGALAVGLAATFIG